MDPAAAGAAPPHSAAGGLVLCARAVACGLPWLSPRACMSRGVTGCRLYAQLVGRRGGRGRPCGLNACAFRSPCSIRAHARPLGTLLLDAAGRVGTVRQSAARRRVKRAAPAAAGRRARRARRLRRVQVDQGHAVLDGARGHQAVGPRAAGRHLVGGLHRHRDGHRQAALEPIQQPGAPPPALGSSGCRGGRRSSCAPYCAEEARRQRVVPDPARSQDLRMPRAPCLLAVLCGLPSAAGATLTSG